MALGTPTLALATDFDADDSVSTATFTPTANALLIAFGGARGSILIPIPDLTNTGLTFTPIVDGLYDDGSGARFRGRAWATVIGGTPVPMFGTLTSTGSARVGITFVQITGHDGIPTNAAAADSLTGDPSMTLGTTPAASSTVIAWGCFNGLNAVTPPATFTELEDVNDALGMTFHTCYDAGSAPATVTYSTINAESVGIAIEVTEFVAPAVGIGLRLRRRGMQHMLVR